MIDDRKKEVIRKDIGASTFRGTSVDIGTVPRMFVQRRSFSLH